MITPPRVPKPACLAAHDFDRIVAGQVTAADVYHLDRCARCRAGLVAERDDMVSPAVQELSRVRLAAATFRTAQTVNMQTSDESLSCDLDLDHTIMGITLVADHFVWGDYVVLWPGPGDPYLLPIGARTIIPRTAYYSLDHWRVSKSEAETILHGFVNNSSISFSNTALEIRPRDERLILNWSSPIHSLLAMETSSGEWEEAALPFDLGTRLPVKVRVYTPLTASALLL